MHKGTRRFRTSRHLLVLGFTIAMSATACLVNAGAEKDEATPPRTPRTTQVCIDRSGSYDFSSNALATVADVLPAATGPGDTLFVRWIEENSYAPAATARMDDGRDATWEFPAVSAAPVNPGQFADPFVEDAFHTDSTRVAGEQALFEAFRDGVAAELRAIAPPGIAQRTDVFGCLSKACELLRQPGDVLWIASDLEDNVARDVHCQLPQAHVVVTLFQCDVPCPEKRWHWATLFGSYGARSTTYLDPALPPSALADQFKEIEVGR
jgi:hypothetical protein